MAVKRKVWIVYKVGEFDYSDAERFGEICPIIEPHHLGLPQNELIDKIHERVSKMSEEDFLIMSGPYHFLGLCSAIAADYLGGNLKFLIHKAGQYQESIWENIF